MQQTNKWQARLPFLHLEKYLRMQNLFSENYKNWNKKPAHGRHLW